MPVQRSPLHDGLDGAPARRAGAGRRRGCRPGRRDGARLRAHRPAGGRPGRGPVPGRQRAAARLDRADRLALRDDLRLVCRPRTTGWTWSSRASTPSPRSCSTASLLARTVNMHRTYRFDVRGRLVEGTNQLSVTFGSAIRYADRDQPRARSPAARQPPPVQRGAQDGLQLRLGLGPGPGHGRHLAAGDACSPGAPRGWPPYDRSSTSTAAAARSRCRSTSSGRRWRRRLVVGASVGGATAALTLEPGQTSGTVSLSVDGVERWWPRGHGDQPLYELAVTLRDAAAPDVPLDTWRRRIGFRTVRLVTEEDEHGTSFSFVRQRPAGVRQGRQLDPGRHLPAPGRPGALRRPTRPGGGGGGQPGAGVGRRHLRGRRLLRGVRRTRPDGLAGLPVRLRGLQRGGAVALRGGRRGPGQRHPPDAAPEPGAVERRQREHLGPRRLGLAAAAGRQVVGLGLLHRRPAADRRRARPRPAVRCRQPVVAAPRPAPERPARTAPCTSGTSGTRSTTSATAAGRRGSWRSSAGRGRRPGRRCAARRPTTR